MAPFRGDDALDGVKADVAPLGAAVGSVSLVFWLGMLADKVTPLLRSEAIVTMASHHATALVLAPALSALALVVVTVIRLVGGPFVAVRMPRQTSVEIGGGAAAFAIWVTCVLAESLIVKAWW